MKRDDLMQRALLAVNNEIDAPVPAVEEAAEYLAERRAEREAHNQSTTAAVENIEAVAKSITN